MTATLTAWLCGLLARPQVGSEYARQALEFWMRSVDLKFRYQNKHHLLSSVLSFGIVIPAGKGE